MNEFQQEIYKTIDILTEEKLKQLGFDKTKRGKVISVDSTACVVEIDGDNYTCRLRKGIYIQPNDIVFVKFPQNNNVDKYVDTVLGGNEIPEYLVISAEEILAKLKTVDGEGSGLDADMLDGKHGNEFATKEDIEGISIDGDTIVQNINTSTSIIDDKNLSANVNDSISKKHDHSNKSILDTITQALIDGWNNAVAHISDKIKHITSSERALWNTVSNKSDKGHTHMESDITNLDKYTKAETDTKLGTKADKTYVDNELANKVDKITGKGLSTEDYTTAEKTKLSNIEDGAEKNKVDSVNGKTGDVVINKADIGLSNVENKSSATIRNEITKINVTNALGYTPENSSNKGVANGYAPLDSNIKIPLSMLPDIAKQQTYVVETIADRDNLTGLIMGEKCYITTLGDSYIWDGIKWVTLAKADWENVNLQWVNIVGKPQSNVADIDDATSKRHTHSNKSIIDTITQTLIDRWNSAWNHISDAIRHITSAERTKWNTVDNKADTNYVDTELNKKSNKGHIHTETDISDLDKYTKAETDAKLNLKQDKLGYTPLKEIPIASPTLLGGIKVGNNLTIAEDGTLSALSGDEKSTFIIKQELFVSTEGQTLFNLTKGHYQPNTNTISVYLYGGKQPNISFNEISTSAFEFTEPLKAGTVVLVEYIELSSATPYPIHGNDHLTGGYDPIPKATNISDGLMAKEDKAKLNTIEQGANKYIHPKTHSLDMITETADKKILTASERNKITEVDNKVDKVSGKGLSDENYTLAEKNKLAGIATGATKNDTDVNLKNRANHTGTQPSSTISDFASTVRNTVLTGLSTATNTAITATDTVLSALGKLQKQISDNLSTTQIALGNKSDKNHKHTKSEITDFPTSLPANGGNADTVGGKRPGDFTLQSYTDSNIYPVNNVAMVNLGRPTVTEMALIDSQATNKIWFHSIDKMIFEESDDGIVFNERSDISDTDKRRLVSGNSNASISIPKGKYFRITIFPRSYVYLNWIYMYFSTTGNKAKFKCEKKRNDGDWITHFDYTNSVSGWPGHVFIPHSTIAFSPNSTSGHYNQVRITIATDEQTNTHPNMTLYGLEWWGGYPGGSRDIFSYDEYQNVTFPEELKAKTFKNASGKEVAYQNDIPVKLSELNKDIDFDERYYTKSETYTKTEVNTKLDSKVDNSRVLTDVPANAKFTDTIYTHPSTHPASMITESTTKRFVSDTEKANWNKKAEISDIPTKVGQLENDKNYVTQAELGNAGYGDMTKSIYDANNNGIVDIAEDSQKLGGKNASEYATKNEIPIIPSIWESNVVQTRDNFVGWEKNILFNATEKYTIIETNSKANDLKEFFNGTLSPTNVPNISPDNPYILEILGLPRRHTQGKAVIGWVSRYRYPTKFKIETSDGNMWMTRADISNYKKQYYYTDRFGGIVEKIRFTIYEVNNMEDAYAQIGQFVFIHPEEGCMYDGLLAKEKDIPTEFYHVGTIPPSNNNLLWINTNL